MTDRTAEDVREISTELLREFAGVLKHGAISDKVAKAVGERVFAAADEIDRLREAESRGKREAFEEASVVALSIQIAGWETESNAVIEQATAQTWSIAQVGGYCWERAANRMSEAIATTLRAKAGEG